MRRIGSVAASLLAALALGAVATSSASAECVGCHVQLSSDGGGPFAIEGGSFDVLATSGKPLVRCQLTAGSIAFADGSGFNDSTITASGCTNTAGVSCSSSGASPGEIHTSELNLEIGLIDGRAASAGVEQVPQNSEHVYASFACGATQMELSGGLAGSITPADALVPAGGHFSASFLADRGKQTPANLESRPPLGLELSENGAPAKKVTLASVLSIVPSNPAEIITFGPTPRRPPELGRCLKATPLNSGEFSDKNCRTEVAPAAAGFEWVPAPAGAGFDGSYAVAGKGMTLASAAGTIACSASSGSGEFDSAKGGVEQLTFTGCAIDGVGCSSGGDALDPESGVEQPGTIVTKPLAISLLEPAAGVAWTQLSALAGGSAGIQAAFHCGSDRFFQVSGSLAGETTPVDTMTRKLTTSFAAGGGEQALSVSTFDGSGFVEVTGGALEIAKVMSTFATKVEIETANA